MCDIALGLKEHELQGFAASLNAIHSDEWEDRGLYDKEEIDGSWGAAFQLTMDRTLAAGKRIHFNLTGLDIPDALAGDPAIWVHGHTAWELRQIVRNHEWFAGTLFYLDGNLLDDKQVAALGIEPM